MAIRDYDRLFIGGDWVAPEGTDTIAVISPSTEEVIASGARRHRGRHRQGGGGGAHRVRPRPWPRMTPAERGAILSAVAAQITAEMGDMAEIITSEMGSPISSRGMGQVLAPTMIFSYYAGLAVVLRLRRGARRPAGPRCW